MSMIFGGYQALGGFLYAHLFQKYGLKQNVPVCLLQTMAGKKFLSVRFTYITSSHLEPSWPNHGKNN